MLHNHRAGHVIVAVAMLAVMSGCTNGTTPPPQDAPSGTASIEGSAPDTPDESASASPSSPSETSTETATATATATTTAEDGSIALSRGDEYKVSSPDTTVSITCTDGGDVDIETNGAVLTIVGDCEDVDIDGNDNNVTGENADKLDVEGTGNTAAFANIREIDIGGSTNDITVEDTSDIEVEGDNNTVTYTSGDPAIEIEGNNSVTAP